MSCLRHRVLYTGRNGCEDCVELAARGEQLTRFRTFAEYVARVCAAGAPTDEEQAAMHMMARSLLERRP